MIKLSKSKPVRAIIFLDIDGTLLGKDQKSNEPELPGLIRQLARRGFQFGLNSNRAYEDVLPIIKAFHLTGPFVLENGAYILPALDKKKIFTKRMPADIPSRVKRSLSAVINAKFPDAKLVYADTVKLIKKGNWPQGVWFFANRNRKFSASIHNRVNGRPSFPLAVRIAKELNAHFRIRQPDLKAVANRHGGTVTIEVRGVHKGSSLGMVRRLYPGTPLIAIGDGEGDIVLRPYVDGLYAVRNAIPQLKKVSDGIAAQPLARGGLGIFKNISPATISSSSAAERMTRSIQGWPSPDASLFGNHTVVQPSSNGRFRFSGSFSTIMVLGPVRTRSNTEASGLCMYRPGPEAIISLKKELIPKWARIASTKMRGALLRTIFFPGRPGIFSMPGLSSILNSPKGLERYAFRTISS